MNARHLKAAALVALAASAGPALAHTGHGHSKLVEGLAHPLGLDHLLAMVAVGVWAAVALRGAERLYAPVAFMAALIAGAVLGAAWGALPLIEPAIAASVLLLGVMLAVPARIAPHAGLLLVAAAGLLHGVAHGAEAPAGGLAGFAGYATGFLVATAALHGLGLAAGEALKRVHALAVRALGIVVGLTGAALLLMPA